MKLTRLFKLYKRNIYNNKAVIFSVFMLFGVFIILDSWISSLEYSYNVHDIMLLYNNLSAYRQWVYISIWTVCICKMISFSENSFYILRLGNKKNAWNLILFNVIITSFFISLFIVILSYICGFMINHRCYMSSNQTIILLITLVIILTIGFSLFNIAVIIIRLITKSENIAYMCLLAYLIIEITVLGPRGILCYLSFNIEYLENINMAFLNIFKFSLITFLLCQLGRFIYIKNENYNTKKR